MIELPPAQAVAIGLGSIPRTFRPTAGPDMSDRSMWTDTPEDRLRKQREKVKNTTKALSVSILRNPIFYKFFFSDLIGGEQIRPV